MRRIRSLLGATSRRSDSRCCGRLAALVSGAAPSPQPAPQAPRQNPPPAAGAVVRSLCSLIFGGLLWGAALRLSPRLGPGAAASLRAPPPFPPLSAAHGAAASQSGSAPPASFLRGLSCPPTLAELRRRLYPALKRPSRSQRAGVLRAPVRLACGRRSAGAAACRPPPWLCGPVCGLCPSGRRWRRFRRPRSALQGCRPSGLLRRPAVRPPWPPRCGVRLASLGVTR